jgi:hypothetical protein
MEDYCSRTVNSDDNFYLLFGGILSWLKGDIFWESLGWFFVSFILLGIVLIILTFCILKKSVKINEIPVSFYAKLASKDGVCNDICYWMKKATPYPAI